MNKREMKRSLMPYTFLFIFIVGCLIAFNLFDTKVHELTWDEFLTSLNGNEITELTITPKVRTETYQLTGKLEEYKDNESFILYLPYSDEFISKITDAKERCF